MIWKSHQVETSVWFVLIVKMDYLARLVWDGRSCSRQKYNALPRDPEPAGMVEWILGIDRSWERKAAKHDRKANLADQLRCKYIILDTRNLSKTIVVSGLYL